MEDNRNISFDWDDEITVDGNGGEYTLLPEGDYPFVVLGFEKAMYDGGAKIPSCKMAKVKLRFTGAEGSTTIEQNLFLHSKMEWQLSAFFGAIGQKKKGEPLKMDWSNIIGAEGYARLYIDNYVKKDGTQGQSNKIKYFIYKDEAPVLTSDAIKDTFGGTSW